MNYRVTSLCIIAWVAGFVVIQGCGGGAPLPHFEVKYSGIMVRLSADSEIRKPYLRVDVSLFFPGETGADEIMAGRLGGAEGKDAANRGLGSMPPVEEVELDQNFAQDTAEEAIKEAFTSAGLPAPLKVRFSSFVIQG